MAGLEVFAPDGVLRYRVGDRIFKLFGTAQIGDAFTGGATSGVILNDGWTNYPINTPFAWVINGTLDPRGGYAATFSFAGNALTWEFPRAGSPAYTRPNTIFAFGIW